MYTVARELDPLSLLRDACVEGQLSCVKKICEDNRHDIKPGAMAKAQVFEALLGVYARTKSAPHQCILDYLVSSRPPVLAMPFKRHRSLLHMAVAAGLPPVVLDDLITQGNSIRWQRDRLSPSHTATTNAVVDFPQLPLKRTPVYELGGEGVEDAASLWLCLKRHCARLRVTDTDGCNVMHVLCAWAKPAALQLLTNEEARADVEPLLSRRDSWGRLPLHYACMDDLDRGSPRESPAMRKRVQHTLKLLPSANRRQEILRNLDAPTTRTSLIREWSVSARLVDAIIGDTPQELWYGRDNFNLTPVHYTLVTPYPHLEAVKAFREPPPEVDDLQLFIACWANMTLRFELQRQRWWHLDMVCSKKWRAAADQARSVLQGGHWPYDHEVPIPTPPNELPDPRPQEAFAPTPPPADMPLQADRRRPRSPSPVSHGYRCSDAGNWHDQKIRSDAGDFHDQKRRRRRSRSKSRGRSETRAYAGGVGSLETETRDRSHEREGSERSGRGDSLSKYRPERLWSRSRSRSRPPPRTHERSRPSPLPARITSPVTTPSSARQPPRSPAKSAAKPVAPPVIVPSLSGLGSTEPTHDAATVTSVGQDSSFMEVCSVEVLALRKENRELGQKVEKLANKVEAFQKERDHARSQLDVLRKDVAVLEAELGATDVRAALTAVKGLKQARDVAAVRLSELEKEVGRFKSLESDNRELRQINCMFQSWIQDALKKTGAQDIDDVVIRAQGYQRLKEEQENRCVVKADAADGDGSTRATGVVAPGEVAVKEGSNKVNGGPGRYDHSDW